MGNSTVSQQSNGEGNVQVEPPNGSGTTRSLGDEALTDDFLQHGCEQLAARADHDGIWACCRDNSFRQRQVQVSQGYEWTISSLEQALRLYCENGAASKYPDRLAWLLLQLRQSVIDAQADFALSVDCLSRGDLDSVSRVEQATRMLRSDSEALFLQASCLLHAELDLQAARPDADPNGEGLSLILRSIHERLPEPKKEDLYDTGFKHTGFLGPLAVRLASHATHEDIAAFFSHCDSDSLLQMLKHICKAVRDLPPVTARPPLMLALALGAEVNWSFRFDDPIDDICKSAAEKGLLRDVLAVTRQLPDETAQSFECKAVLAAYEAGDTGSDPLQLLLDVESIRERDDTGDTLACRMADEGDIASALRVLQMAVSIDAYEYSLIRVARICRTAADRDVVLSLARKMRKGEKAASVLIVVAEAVQEDDPTLAAQLLNEALERAREPDDAEDGVLAIVSAAEAMHKLGLTDKAQRALGEAIESCSDIDEDYKQDCALRSIAEAFAETGKTGRVPEVLGRLNDSTETLDVVEYIASTCAEKEGSSAFAAVFATCIQGLPLSREESPEDDIASILKAFAGVPGRSTVFAVVEEQVAAGNLVAAIALARAIGEEGRLADALEMLSGLEIKEPSASSRDGFTPSEDQLDRMMQGWMDGMENRSGSETMFELLEGAFQEAGGESMFDEIEPTEEDEECYALPGKIVAVAQSLIDAAVAHKQTAVVDDLICLLQESAQAIPGTMLHSSEELASDAIKSTTKQLAKLGLVDRACALAATITTDGERNECLKEVVDVLLDANRLDEVEDIIERIDDVRIQDLTRVGQVRALAARDMRAAFEESGRIQDPQIHEQGLRMLAGVSGAGRFTAEEYGDLLSRIATAHVRANMDSDIPDWCFFTMPLALATAGVAPDIPRFLSLIPADNERRDELATHGLGEGIDVLIENGYTDGLSEYIKELPDEELRDGRRRRLAVQLGRAGNPEAAKQTVEAMEGEGARAWTQELLAEALLERGLVLDAIQIVDDIDPEQERDWHNHHDGAVKKIVRYCVDSGDLSNAHSAVTKAKGGYCMVWGMAMLAKGFFQRGQAEEGHDLVRTSLNGVIDAKKDRLHADLIRYFCEECGDHVDVAFLIESIEQVADPEQQAKAAAHLVSHCLAQGDADRALEIINGVYSRVRAAEHDGGGEGTLERIVAMYIACSEEAAAQQVVDSAGDESKDRLLTELDVAVAKSAGNLDATGQVTLETWSRVAATVDRIQSGARQIRACRRLLDLPAVRESSGCRDHLARLAVRAFRGLDKEAKAGLREGLVNTLVACGCPSEAASLVEHDTDTDSSHAFVRFTRDLASEIGSSDAPQGWIKLLGLIEVPDPDSQQAVLQQAAYHLCQRKEGHLQATEELFRLIESSGLSLAESATAYVHSHMAVSMLGAEVFASFAATLPHVAVNPRIARSAAFALLAILFRSGRYDDARDIAESCPGLGLAGVFRG